MADCALRNRIKQVAAKLQDLEGVAEALGPADVVPTVFEVAPAFDISTFERQPFKSTLGREANITGTVTHNINMQLEVKGAGVAGDEPNYSKFLIACGFAPVKLAQLTISGAAGGPLAKGDVVTGGTSGATGRVLVISETPATEVIVVPTSGVFAAVEALSSPTTAPWSAQLDAVDLAYGFGYEPYSKTTKCIDFQASPAYQAGEHVLGGTSGALGRVIYVGDSHMWYEPLNSIDFVAAENVTGQVTSVGQVLPGGVSPICCQPTPPLTMQVNQDGVRTIARGMRGRVNFNFPAVGEPVRMEYEFQGVLEANPDDDLAEPEVADSLLPPKFQGADIQIDRTVATPYCPILTSLNVQVDNTLTSRMDAKDAKGIKSYIITNRDFSGSMDPEMVAVADYPIHQKLFEDELEDLYLRIEDATPVAGNIIEWYADRLQWTEVNFGNREDILTAEASFRLVQTLGDDALHVIVR